MTTFPPNGASTRFEKLDDCEDEVKDLRAALETRPTIDQAKGMLIIERGCSPDEAFEILTKASQHYNRKVRDIAEAMVEGAQVPKPSNS
jgi:AmiR/NasT family two-component response regulator